MAYRGNLNPNQSRSMKIMESEAQGSRISGAGLLRGVQMFAFSMFRVWYA